MLNVAINGLGRIGRAALKILLDANGLDLVAVNDIADVGNLAYLLRYDSAQIRHRLRPLRASGQHRGRGAAGRRPAGGRVRGTRPGEPAMGGPGRGPRAGMHRRLQRARTT